MLVSRDEKWDYAIGMIKVDGLEPTPEMSKLIEKEKLLSQSSSGVDFLHAINELAQRYSITDEMTKNFFVYNFQKEKLKND